jgi:hypothetical protein
MGGLGDEAPADEIFETLLRHRPHSISRRLLHSMQRSSPAWEFAVAMREKRQEVRNQVISIQSESAAAGSLGGGAMSRPPPSDVAAVRVPTRL